MERKLWNDDAIRNMHNNPVFAGIVEMIEHALHAGKIDVEVARSAGLLAVNRYALHSGLRPFVLVQMPPGQDGDPPSITVDGVVYVHDPMVGRK